MSYDPRYYDVAESFLEDAGAPLKPEIVFKLAARIKDNVEDFLEDGDNFPQPEPMFDTSRERDEWRHKASEAQKLK